MQIKARELMRCSRRTLLVACLAGICASGLAEMGGNPAKAEDVANVAKNGSTLILLGTAGGPKTRKYRSQPAALLVVNDQRFLIDCGAGTSRQLAQVGYDPADISRVFLTHLHFDHTEGLAALLAFDWVSQQAHTIQVYGPPGTHELVQSAISYDMIPANIFKAMGSGPVDMSKIAVGLSKEVSTTPRVIYQDQDVKVTAVENTHYSATDIPRQPYGQPHSYSYRFEMKDRTIVFTGDTGPSPAVTKLASGADILVSEVIDPQVIAAQAKSSSGSEAQREAVIAHFTREHLTPNEVGKMAKAAGVRMVVLTHLGLAKDEEGAAAPFIKGVHQEFSGPVVAGRDLDQF